MERFRKGKGIVYPRTDNEDPEGEYRYSSTLSLNSTLDGMGGQRHAPAALTSGKIRYPFCRRGCAPGQVWTLEENLALHRDSIPGPSSL